MELEAERALPAGVRGPVERRALARLAARAAGVMVFFGFVSEAGMGDGGASGVGFRVC